MNHLDTSTTSVHPFDITVWRFNETPIRQILIDGEPWFIGKDVAAILGYSNTKEALAAHVDSEDKRVVQRSEITTFDLPNRGMTFINESGVYALIFGSKLPGAKEFKSWVTSVVLPSIRKNGVYATPEAAEKLFQDPVFLYNIARGYCVMTKRVSELNKRMANMIEAPSHLVTRIADQFNLDEGDHPDFFTTSSIAHLYGREARWLNAILEHLGVQHRDEDGVWRLNDPIADKRFRRDSTYHKAPWTYRIPTSYWTPAGREFVIALLRADGIEPIGEDKKEE